jgi:hypothetical protein
MPIQPHGGGQSTAKTWKAAMAEAEAVLVRPGEDGATEVRLTLDQIETRPILFQPRDLLGKGTTDKAYSTKLKTRISNVGELNAVTVIKLGDAWVLIDGHHRVEAYRKTKGWTKPIKCQWFAGTVREAVDVGVQRNSELNLEMSQQDRWEQAWKRVLDGGWRREKIRKTCSVGPKLLTHMNNVVSRYRDKTDRSKATRTFRQEVAPLDECSWARANTAYCNLPQAERTREEQAQGFAALLRGKLSHKLSEDPELTAMALLRYDRKLPSALCKAWGKPDPMADLDFDYATEATGDFGDEGDL